MTNATGKGINNISNRSTRVFALCKASGLNLDDKFMKHIPNTDEEAHLKMMLEAVIKEGVKDFFVPKADPSFDAEGNLCYMGESDRKIAIGKSYDWWKKQARNFCPERVSRIGTEKEFIAYLGVRLKKLTKVEMNVDEAWEYVCSTFLKPTIFRKVCGFFGLPMHRLLASNNEKDGGFWVSGDGQEFPLSAMHYYKCTDVEHFNGIGWVICEK